MRFVDPTGMGEEESESVFQNLLSKLPSEMASKANVMVQSALENGIPLDHIAIGVEYSLGTSAEGGVKSELGVMAGVVIFLGGSDAGYVYSYIGGEAGSGIETALGTHGSGGVSLFVAFNLSDSPSHDAFDGSYGYARGNIGITADLFGLTLECSVGFSYAKGIGSPWHVVSFETTADGGVGVKSPVDVSVTGGLGTIKFNQENVGGSKSFWQTLSSSKRLIPVIGAMF